MKMQEGRTNNSQEEREKVLEAEPLYLMNRIVQWNCKSLRATHKEVLLLMNKFQSSCICLEEVMQENVKYNLETEYV